MAFGPVAGAQGGFGVGIVEVDDPSVVAALESGDPAIRANIGMRYEVSPMPSAFVRPR